MSTPRALRHVSRQVRRQTGHRRCQRGAALVEALVATSTLMVFFALALMLFDRYSARASRAADARAGVWAERAAQADAWSDAARAPAGPTAGARSEHPIKNRLETAAPSSMARNVPDRRGRPHAPLPRPGELARSAGEVARTLLERRTQPGRW